jgi:hypothetical protein
MARDRRMCSTTPTRPARSGRTPPTVRKPTRPNRRATASPRRSIPARPRRRPNRATSESQCRALEGAFGDRDCTRRAEASVRAFHPHHRRRQDRKQDRPGPYRLQGHPDAPARRANTDRMTPIGAEGAADTATGAIKTQILASEPKNPPPRHLGALQFEVLRGVQSTLRRRS